MLVEINDLVKRYGDLLAVDHVNLEIREGEILGLLGPNGAGKTTTLNMLLGLTRIDGGTIKIFGQQLGENAAQIKKQIGIVPQEIAIYEDLTAAENVSFFGRLYDLQGALLRERVHEALSFAWLEEKKNQFPRKFSGGMKRRLNIACALVHHPRLIIMDEPTVGIDPQSRKHILDSVRELHEQGATILYTTHYMEEAEELCTRIAIMDQGRVIALGTTDELKELVSSEERIVIEVAAAGYTLVEQIKKLHGVRECGLAEKTLTVMAARNSGMVRRLIDLITAAGTEIVSLNVERITLESVFLTLTGRTLRD
ncbi:MAG: ABC transporter ATP-binding protein [Firmicutes bacterium]|jgi:ABC-2 type transport system ATP-binding protein|nr:ABC transporter ATP-binding protein [Bacillota bacterium]